MAVPKWVVEFVWKLQWNSFSRSLGSLNYLHIWHDNSGQGQSASWFMKYLIIQDLQTMKKDHFICQRWLAVEKDDGKVKYSFDWSLLWKFLLVDWTFISRSEWNRKKGVFVYFIEKNSS